MAWKKTVNHQAAGDAHRAAGDWSKAATAYKLHLDGKPDDAAIWVQYGHALKETHRREEAELAYGTAVELRPDDGDAWLHLAHLLKVQGKYVAAYGAFTNAMAIDPTGDVNVELRKLRRLAGETHPQGKDLKDGTILFAIQDLLIFLRYHVTMSGIQRVQCGICQHLMDLELFFRAHDLKGLGSTYQYPLVTRLAGSLCRLLDDPSRRLAVPMVLIDAHIDAIRAVVRDRIQTDDHPTGRILAETLEAEVAAHRAG